MCIYIIYATIWGYVMGKKTIYNNMRFIRYLIPWIGKSTSTDESIKGKCFIFWVYRFQRQFYSMTFSVWWFTQWRRFDQFVVVCPLVVPCLDKKPGIVPAIQGCFIRLAGALHPSTLKRHLEFWLVLMYPIYLSDPFGSSDLPSALFFRFILIFVFCGENVSFCEVKLDLWQVPNQWRSKKIQDLTWHWQVELQKDQ